MKTIGHREDRQRAAYGFDRIEAAMAKSLRAAMSGALLARREQRGLSLEALARRTSLTKPGVHGIETGRTGEFLDRLEEIAVALGARWSVALVPTEGADTHQDAIGDLQAVPVEQLPELRQLLRAWPSLTSDDRALIALLAERRQRAPAEVVELLPSATVRRKAQQ